MLEIFARPISHFVRVITAFLKERVKSLSIFFNCNEIMTTKYTLRLTEEQMRAVEKALRGYINQLDTFIREISDIEAQKAVFDLYKEERKTIYGVLDIIKKELPKKS